MQQLFLYEVIDLILGLVTDIIEISRMKKAIEKRQFVQRVFTQNEIAYCDSRGAQRAASYAARFAGKEAVLKAFGTGLRHGSLQDIEILPDALGCPRLQLSGYFARLAEERAIQQFFVSLSHAREYAVAQCIFGRD